MKKKQIIYTQILGAIASIFVALGIKHMIELFAASENIVQDVSVFVILIIITALCRSLPLRIKDDEDIDMSFIIIFAMVLTQGWKYAVCVILLHTFFSVIKSDEHNGKYVSLIKYSVLKCCFNTSNYIICTSIGGIVWGLCGGVSGQPALGLPYSMLPSAAFVLVMISVNSLLLLGILSFTNNFKFLKTFFSMMLQFLPNMILSASMGYFFALMLSLESGQYIALLFMLPILLARYAFKMYLDSRKQYLTMVKALTATLEAKDSYTEGHGQRVCMIAEEIAKIMGLSEKRIENIRVGALLHDIGKIGVSDSILNKPDKLTEAEFEQIKRHPVIGAHIIKEMQLNQVINEIILHHHERYDGRGYPDGLGGDKLLIETYIVSVADALDAMTSDRPYRQRYSYDKALKIIIENSGSQFCPEVVDAIIKLDSLNVVSKEDK